MDINARETGVFMNYDAISHVLSVAFTVYNSSDSSSSVHDFNYVIDLRSYLPEYVVFGFSSSTGMIYTGVNNVKSWYFNSTSVPAPTPPDPSLDFVITDGRRRNKKLALAIGLSFTLSLVIVLIGLCFYWEKSSKDAIDPSAAGHDTSSHPHIDDDEFEKCAGPKKFSREELFEATENFAEQHKLGGGGFGAVYRGTLKGNEIAVKKVSRDSKQGTKEYKSELKIISQLRHKNLVPLLVWCHQVKGELLLVYKYMPNGSLDYHLFTDQYNSVLPWVVRYRVARGLASSLVYLHEYGEQCVLHRDIKPANIMLDSEFKARIGDFGLARFVDHDKEAQTTVPGGYSMLYSPRIYDDGEGEQGIRCLQFRSCIARNSMWKKSRWFGTSAVGLGDTVDAADPKLGQEFDKREMENLIVLGLWCAHPDDSHRPSVSQVLHVLKFEAALPTRLSMTPPRSHCPPAMTMFAIGSSSSESSCTVKTTTLGNL